MLKLNILTNCIPHTVFKKTMASQP